LPSLLLKPKRSPLLKPKANVHKLLHIVWHIWIKRTRCSALHYCRSQNYWLGPMYIYGSPCSSLPTYYETKVPHEGFPALAVAVTTSNSMYCGGMPPETSRQRETPTLCRIIYLLDKCHLNRFHVEIQTYPCFLSESKHRLHHGIAFASPSCTLQWWIHTHVGKGVACCFPAHLETRKRKRSYIVSKVPTFLITPKGSCIAVQGTIIIGFCQHHRIP
jgi:hypothetical protein